MTEIREPKLMRFNKIDTPLFRQFVTNLLAVYLPAFVLVPLLPGPLIWRAFVFFPAVFTALVFQTGFESLWGELAGTYCILLAFAWLQCRSENAENLVPMILFILSAVVGSFFTLVLGGLAMMGG